MMSDMRGTSAAQTAVLVCFFSGISFLPHPVLEKILFVFFPVLFALTLITSGRPAQRYHVIERGDWPVWLFIVSLGAGIVNAIDVPMAFRFYSMMALICITAFYVGKLAGCGSAGFDGVSRVVIICMLVVGAVAVGEIAAGGNFIYDRFVPNQYYVRYAKHASRPMATLLNPAVAGSYFVGCIPFAFYFLEQKKRMSRISGAVVLTLGVAIVMYAASRGVFLGLLAGLLFYFIVRRKKLYGIVVGLAALVLVAAASVSGHAGFRQFGFQKLFAGSHDSMVSRYRIERVAMTARVLKAHPLAGIGPGHFRLRFYEYSAAPKGELVPYELMIPDNMYLSIAAEAGAVGICGFIFFCVYVSWRAWRNFMADRRAYRICMIPLAGLVGLLINMAAYDLFYWHNPFALFCFLAGLSAADVGRTQ